jgi:hypothetical protein
MLLVPSFMRVMGRFNWWAPEPLARLYQRFPMREPEGQSPSPAAAPVLR